jgi:hypothetical protein
LPAKGSITTMSGATLDEDAVDEVLYLARANEASELESYMTELSAQKPKHSKAELLAAAVDPHSKNGALHYAAANGHTGTSLSSKLQFG